MTLPKRIVIVEDEVITQRFLQDIFVQYGTHVVGCFDNAADLLAQIKELECDLILMDINIKGPMDGIQLTRKILEKYVLPIVFITAHNDDETVEETLELSPYGFICKPFTSKDVIATVKVAYKQYLSRTHTEKRQTSVYEDSDTVTINETYTYSKKLSQLYRNSTPVDLTKNQYLLVRVLVEHINRTVHYEVLITSIWEEAEVADSALRTLVYSLRKILPDLPVRSHSKIGYALELKR